MTDDQAYTDMKALPKTRVLIGSGTEFVNTHVALPLCCPSRATFLTGQYPHNNGIWGNSPPAGGYEKLRSSQTLPVWLENVGYFTAHIGKYLNGYGQKRPYEVPPGWTHWQGSVDRSTYWMYNYTLNDNGTLVRYGDAPEHYQTDVYAARAVATIEKAAASGKHFFLSVAPTAPHYEDDNGPVTTYSYPNPRPALRDMDAYASAPLLRPPPFNEADVSDKPSFIRNLPRLTYAKLAYMTARYRSRLASLLAVDDLVERIVDTLRATGTLDNTVIIFTSDNGYHIGQHRRMEGKRDAYEEDTRVPLYIKGGPFQDGAKVKTLTSNIDLAPTILALAGAKAGVPVDGRSLVGTTGNTPRSLLIESQSYAAVRNQSFLYVEHKYGERELYDMRRGTTYYDPYQLVSRHQQPGYATIRRALATKLAKLRRCAGASCRGL
jgi:arylsulfatase A-like enzyme